MKLPKVRWPHLELRISLPFLWIHTELMHKPVDRDTYEYIHLYVKLWKWDWRFRLYRPLGR